MIWAAATRQAIHYIFAATTSRFVEVEDGSKGCRSYPCRNKEFNRKIMVNKIQIGNY